MANPEREVRLPVPQGPFASEILARMPKDIVKSVSGSAAAAGSGEFHVYKNSRRREFERVKLMEEQQRAVSSKAARELTSSSPNRKSSWRGKRLETLRPTQRRQRIAPSVRNGRLPGKGALQAVGERIRQRLPLSANSHQPRLTQQMLH